MKLINSSMLVILAGGAATLLALVTHLPPSHAASAPPLLAPEIDCWQIIDRDCDDCPPYKSYFCNPISTGNLVACVPAQSSVCEGGGCVNVSGTTGICP